MPPSRQNDIGRIYTDGFYLVLFVKDICGPAIACSCSAGVSMVSQ